MMNNYLVYLKHQIIEELDRSFNTMVSIDIRLVAEAIDKKNILLTKDTLHQLTGLVIKGSSLDENYLEDKLKVKNNHFIIDVSTVQDEPDALSIAYLDYNKFDRRLNKDNPICITINNSVGRFKKIYVLVPEYLKVNTFKISNIIKTIFETSYDWLFDKIEDLISKSYIPTKNLYRRMKTALGSNKQHIFNSMWFVVEYNGNCVLLLDSKNVSTALFQLNKNNIHPRFGAYRLLDEFINMRLPHDQAFAKESLKAGHCINGVISKGRYVDDLPLLALTQKEIFSDEVSVQPIVKEGKYKLYTSFPTKYRSSIEPVLELNKTLLNDDFNRLNPTWKQVITQMGNNNINMKMIAEFMGSYSGSFFSACMRGAMA